MGIRIWKLRIQFRAFVALSMISTSTLLMISQTGKKFALRRVKTFSFPYVPARAFENMSSGGIQDPVIPRMQAAFHPSKIKTISIKLHSAIMSHLVDTSLPKADVLIISTSIGPSERTAYAHWCCRNFKYTQPRLLEYAGRHRYKIRLFVEPANSTYTAHWQKLLWLRYLLTGGTNASIIAFFDDDILITNLSVRIENFFSLVDDPEKIHFIGSRDHWVNNYKFLINSGTLLVRNSRKSLEFVKYAIKLHDEIPHIQRFVHLDQDAVIIAHLEFFYEHSLLLPMCVLQSSWSTYADIYAWKPGHFALHHLWSHYEDRMENFAQLRNNISSWWETNRANVTMNCIDEDA